MRLRISMDFKENSSARLEFRDAEQTVELINVSHLDDVLKIPAGNEGFKGFQLSDSEDMPLTPLDGTYRFYDDTVGYSGIITEQLSEDTFDNEGYYVGTDVDFYFYIATEMPKTFFIVFDTINNEYATSFSIYGVTSKVGTAVHNNTSPVALLNVDDGLLGEADMDEMFCLSIHRWSKPNSSIKISRIASYPRFDFGSKDITKMVCSENLFDSALQIRPGICEQYASIDVYDRFGILHSMYIREEFSKKNDVSIYAVDDVAQKTYLLGTYTITSGDTECDNSVVSFECQDTSRLFDQINIPALPVKDRTCDELLSILFSNVNKPWKYIDTETELLCKSLKTPNNWSTSSSATVLLDKICLLGMLRVYWYVDTFIIARCVNVST